MGNICGLITNTISRFQKKKKLIQSLLQFFEKYIIQISTNSPYFICKPKRETVNY